MSAFVENLDLDQYLDYIKQSLRLILSYCKFTSKISAISKVDESTKNNTEEMTGIFFQLDEKSIYCNNISHCTFTQL